YAYVIASIPGSPAAKAGIERGDFIEKVDGKATQKMAVWQVRNALHSAKAVQLQVLRGGQTKRDEFTIQQANYHPLALSTQKFGSIDYNGDVEVLTDNSTASGAEIFAAAIHGNSRGKIVGVNTYGKAIVQKFIALPSGGGVMMTVAHYTTPELKPIKEGGVKPDVV